LTITIKKCINIFEETMKKLSVIFIIISMLISACIDKNEEFPNNKSKLNNEPIKLDIVPSLTFDFNGDNYKIEFFGKGIGVKYTSHATIIVNGKEYDYSTIVLSREDKCLINEELKDYKIAVSAMRNIDNNMIINIQYKELHEEYILGENKELTIIASQKLKDFLINKLLYIYSLPLYTVQEGDTLSGICLKFFGDMNYKRIVDVNPQLEWANQYLVVHPNGKIRIPKE
jgi:uncharacterized protein (DUF1697 family)